MTGVRRLVAGPTVCSMKRLVKQPFISHMPMLGVADADRANRLPYTAISAVGPNNSPYENIAT
jgi:hypothetical protein